MLLIVSFEWGGEIVVDVIVSFEWGGEIVVDVIVCYDGDTAHYCTLIILYTHYIYIDKGHLLVSLFPSPSRSLSPSFSPVFTFSLPLFLSL